MKTHTTYRLRENGMKAVVCTQTDRCIFDVTENEERIGVDIALTLG